MATITRQESLAGVRIPDTPLAKAAVDLLEVTSPQFICNHCVRTYVFGSLAVRSIGRSIIDEEIAFCGALSHDLGPRSSGIAKFLWGSVCRHARRKPRGIRSQDRDRAPDLSNQILFAQ